jgi:sugar lactone lactonase YvrE
MSRQSTLTTFAPGDIFVAATLLNDENDDHAGAGRIIQYDGNLNEKGVYWTEEPGHLIGGLKFDPEGALWAFDSQEFRIFRIGDGGESLPVPGFPQRSFSSVNFGSDGSIYLGEHLVGDSIEIELGTVISKMPGTDRLGDGHIFRFDPQGNLIKEYATETHGGMGGFLGVTMAALSPDESTMVYTSETSPRLMRYDLVNDKQLPDLVSYPEGQREMFFGMAYDADGALLVTRGKRVDVLDEAGEVTRSYPLEGFGWAMLAPCADNHLLATNFFSGEVAKVNTESGEVVASVNIGVERSVAGITER